MLKNNFFLKARITNDNNIRMEVNPFTLAFIGNSADLEKPFLQKYAVSCLPQVRLALIFGFIFYALFGALDAILALEMKRQFWYVRYGIVCPSILLAFIFSFSPHFHKFVHAVILILIMVSGLGIIYMTTVGNVLMVRNYYVGLILVLIIAYAFIRSRFIWATPACWAIVIIYITSAAMLSQLPAVLLISNIFFVMSANIIGMMVCYSLEYYARRDFIMGCLLDEQNKTLESTKVLLEHKVQERTAMLARANEELRQEIQTHQRLDWEKKALEEQLLQAQKMEAVGTLAGGIAHDFNNMLAAIMGHTELALLQLQDRDETEISLTEVLSACERAKDLVGQILAFSQHSCSELKPLKISLVIKEVLRLLRATLPSTISIQQDIGTKDSVVVADATQIHQILMNLCTNAAHAMLPDGGLLSITLDKREISPETAHQIKGYPDQILPGNYVCLNVSDSGHGIAPHLMDKIFDPYFTTKAKGVGTGLGLAVVRGIVQNHGGTIDVKSQIGKGTTFHIYLPVAEMQTAVDMPGFQSMRNGNERILLVDDEAGLAELGARLLKTLGYRAESCISAEQALKIIHENPTDIDLVITDMIMPVLNGEALARRIIQIRPDLPVIIYTGFGENLNTERLKQIGVKQVLRKPITIRGLSQAIRQVLEEREQPK